MIRHARRGEGRLNDARLGHPWLRINRVLRVMLHNLRSESFRRALALRSQIRRAGWLTTNPEG
jgi:hypothetical protein